MSPREMLFLLSQLAGLTAGLSPNDARLIREASGGAGTTVPQVDRYCNETRRCSHQRSHNNHAAPTDHSRRRERGSGGPPSRRLCRPRPEPPAICLPAGCDGSEPAALCGSEPVFGQGAPSCCRSQRDHPLTHGQDVRCSGGPGGRMSPREREMLFLLSQLAGLTAGLSPNDARLIRFLLQRDSEVFPSTQP